ncbi:hypothetical protein ACSCB1_05165 [Streptomyces europaeiscabiei]|uniref:hypothetical protein n=1 Tax=Streptomyces europaeiscabiei TaxID=146819 RepID=UPI000A97252F|nr:hypothetical protein [Streptomyces europaeiscabiei]
MPAAVVCGAGSVENSPSGVRVAGRAVLLVPHRSGAADEGALPGDCRKILAIVREADGPVQPGRSASGWAWTPRCAASWSRCGRR